MASNLKWRTGFGWGAVVMFVLGICLAVMTSGVTKWGGILLSLLSLLFSSYQFWKWNSSPWRKVHFRAALVYASLAGTEVARARASGDEFNEVNVCRELALALIGREKELNADAMIAALLQEQGAYYVRLLRPHIRQFLPNANDNEIESILNSINNGGFGGDLVVANVIENTYGEDEAARYAFAIFTKEAC